MHMSRTVSVSETGQNKPVPTRAERDAACSSDGGRKAVEEPVKKVTAKKQRPQEPIGLEMETAGDEDRCAS
jgi:hypothetical protein